MKPMIVLTKDQREAMEFFLAHGSVAIDAPRRAGKTWLLQHLVKTHPDTKFKVCCPSYRQFKCTWGVDWPNVSFLAYDNWHERHPECVLIGDEISEPPRQHPHYAIAHTSKATHIWGMGPHHKLQEESFDHMHPIWLAQEFKKYNK